MNSFLWSSGHIGWGIFVLIVFTGLWGLAVDLVWRLKNARVIFIVGAMSAGWMIGALLITFGFWLGNR